MSIIKNIRNVFKDYSDRISSGDVSRSEVFGTKSGRIKSSDPAIQRFVDEDPLILASREIARSLVPEFPFVDYTPIEERIRTHLEEEE